MLASHWRRGSNVMGGGQGRAAWASATSCDNGGTSSRPSPMAGADRGIIMPLCFTMFIQQRVNGAQTWALYNIFLCVQEKHQSLPPPPPRRGGCRQNGVSLPPFQHAFIQTHEGQRNLDFCGWLLLLLFGILLVNLAGQLTCFLPNKKIKQTSICRNLHRNIHGWNSDGELYHGVFTLAHLRPIFVHKNPETGPNIPPR